MLLKLAVLSTLQKALHSVCNWNNRGSQSGGFWIDSDIDSHLDSEFRARISSQNWWGTRKIIDSCGDSDGGTVWLCRIKCRIENRIGSVRIESRFWLNSGGQNHIQNPYRIDEELSTLTSPNRFSYGPDNSEVVAESCCFNLCKRVAESNTFSLAESEMDHKCSWDECII